MLVLLKALVFVGMAASALGGSTVTFAPSTAPSACRPNGYANLDSNGNIVGTPSAGELVGYGPDFLGLHSPGASIYGYANDTTCPCGIYLDQSMFANWPGGFTFDICTQLNGAVKIGASDYLLSDCTTVKTAPSNVLLTYCVDMGERRCESSLEMCSSSSRHVSSPTQATTTRTSPSKCRPPG